MDQGFQFYVGIDWATEAYQVCEMDCAGQTVKEVSVEHSGTGHARFTEELTRLSGGHPESVAVAIEMPRGAVVETLVERGFAVFSINPKQLDRFRDRHTVAGAKDDRRDAFVLADSLRTDQHCFHRVRLDDPLVIQIREMSRVDEDLCQELIRQSNRLRDQLHRFYPQMLEFSPAADDPWLWDLLELAPTPANGRRLRPEQIQAILRRHRIRRLSPSEILEKLKTPQLTVAPGVTEACSAHIALLLPRLRLAQQQRKNREAQIETLLAQVGETPSQEAETREHRDVEILRSLPGIGRVVAATMLAEASQPLEERDYHALRAHAGVAPVTKQSGKRATPRNGKRTTVSMRRACNQRLRNAVYHWARVSAQRDPQTKSHYGALRQRGHSHGRALRGVADRLLRILVAMLDHRTLYDPRRLPAPALTPLEVPA